MKSKENQQKPEFDFKAANHNILWFAAPFFQASKSANFKICLILRLDLFGYCGRYPIIQNSCLGQSE